MSTEAGQSLVERGIAEARSGNRLLARLYLERAVEAPPVAPNLWLWLAWVAESPEKARGYLERLQGTGCLADVARHALPWIRLMCHDGSPLVLPDDAAGTPEPDGAPTGPTEHRVECPGCLVVLYVRGSALGRTRICPACRDAIDIPSDAPSVASSPPLADFDYIEGTAFSSGHGPRPVRGAAANGDEHPSTRRQPHGGEGETRRQQDALGRGDPDRPILVVDDNPLVRTVATTILHRRGYAAEAVANGLEAIAWVSKRLPGLVLLDSQMPGMDGFEVCQRLRSHPRTRDLPIVLMSSQDAFFERVQGRLAGCSVYLTKPCDANVLCATVDEHYAGAARHSGS